MPNAKLEEAGSFLTVTLPPKEETPEEPELAAK